MTKGPETIFLKILKLERMWLWGPFVVFGSKVKNLGKNFFN
ncbi:MAG: hypothetical protein CM15mP58_17410 [Burkholderiaceae bacterium]|nr:MAG: hypothetical protein CM15mP58_17410 [Burkholderiaceae bacterium]